MKYNDYPIEECMKTLEAMYATNPTFTFRQKWTCQHCGSRQTMEEEDTFFRSGECEECQQITIIKECNYQVHFRIIT
jgi:hypothetical protein